LSERAAAERDDVGREAARRILEAADGARQRLARDLHDGAQQQFVSAVINLQLAQARFDSDPQRARRHVDSALRQSEAGLAALRDFVAGIHPPILTNLGLKAAVVSLADGAPILVETDVTEQRLPWLLEESLYFFISEALTNVIKHSQATVAEILVAHAAKTLTVEVADDGVGGATLTSGGTGLLGLVDRVQALGGDFWFSSPAGGGTVVRGSVPLRAELD
jgi:signal transduction histidine kinase